MNNRIKELAEECSMHVECQWTDYREIFDKEKFAKLIVLECQKAADKYISDCGEVASLPEYVFQEHFGVK